ncbi:MAG: contractile injection system tape measure protein, partial [Prolixibacteraceae bacterium]
NFVRGQNQSNYLIDSLEIFFTKGYFPYSPAETVTIDELVTRAIRERKYDFTEILKRHRNHDPVIRRTAYNLNVPSFDETLNALDPVNSKWIIEYRKILMHLKKELNLNQYSDAEFMQMMNYSIAKYVLNETSATFSKKKFSAGILNEFIAIFNPELPDLIGSVKNYTGNTTTTILISETLTKISEEKTVETSDAKKLGLNIDQLIHILNSGSVNFNRLSRDFLKAELIEAMLDQEKSEQLAEQLNEIGTELMLDLFDRGNARELLKQIILFTETGQNALGSKPTTVQKLALITVLNVHESAIRTFDREEFLLFLIYAAGPEASEILKSASFKQFVDSEKTISLSKISSIIELEKKDPEISGIQKLLSEKLFPTKTNDTEPAANQTNANDYQAISKRKIVGYYLDSGQLPPAWSGLNWRDLQVLFSDLIRQKDDLIANKIQKNEDAQNLIFRLNQLADKQSTVELHEYLGQFFPDEAETLFKLLSKARRQFTFGASARIDTSEFVHAIFVRALAESKGGNLPGVFEFLVIESLNTELAKDFHGSEKLFSILTNQTELFPTDSKIQLRKALEHDFSLLVNKFRWSEFEAQTEDSKTRRLVTKLAFYAEADQSVFLDALQNNRKNLLPIYTLFRYNLPQNQWQKIEKLIQARSGLRLELDKFQQQADVVLSLISNPQTDLAKTFEILSISDPEKLKTFLVLILNDDKLFEKFSSETDEIQVLTKLTSANSKTQIYFDELLSFDPGLSGKTSSKFWKSTILSFEFQRIIEGTKFTSAGFAKAFRNHLIDQLKAVNQMDLFYLIANKLKSSASKELKELVDLWQDSKPIESDRKTENKAAQTTATEHEIGKHRTTKNLQHYVLALGFYAQNGFFPWWINGISFPELIDDLNEISRQQPQVFEKAFLNAEKEEQFFVQLIRRIPEYVFPEIDQIISSHQSLAELWRKAMRENVTRSLPVQEKKEAATTEAEHTKPDHFVKNALQNEDLLNKGLYFMDDQDILSYWLKNRPQIATQISEYLALTPLFYFRNITPAQWRKTVYEFALNYYQDEQKPVSKQFHTDFLRHLRIRQSRVNWENALSSVYQLVHSGKANGKVTFPEALVQLLQIEPVSHSVKNVVPNRSKNLHQTDESGIEIKVHNSGLILFWPFLNRLFEYLNLVKNSAFVNRESMNRAVYILQYLAFNEIDFPEYHLVLNKLLVGMSSDEHLEPFVTLTEDEKEKAQSLLHGLIQNWEKVKNSTPEGIQQTFIQREGMLRFSADKVTLIVEKKGVDVLLASIPWNISLVKLAWMKKPIYVEWK